jgi:hypothetical protein
MIFRLDTRGLAAYLGLALYRDGAEGSGPVKRRATLEHGVLKPALPNPSARIDTARNEQVRPSLRLNSLIRSRTISTHQCRIPSRELSTFSFSST